MEGGGGQGGGRFETIYRQKREKEVIPAWIRCADLVFVIDNMITTTRSVALSQTHV